MAKDNEVIRELKEKYIKSLSDLRQKYPEISYKQRSQSDDGTKANDINVYIDDKIALIIMADDLYPNGRLMTNNITQQEKDEAVLVEGRYDDKDEDSLYTKYRYRPKWTPAKYVRNFERYDDFLLEVEKIICRVLEVNMNNTVIKKTDINTPIPPKGMSADEFVVICPTCNEKFQHADRCPNCGQLIDYRKKQVFSVDFESNSRTIVTKCADYMKGENLIFTSENPYDNCPYYILKGKTSVGYRKGEGIVLYCAKDEIDKNAIVAQMGKKVLPNSEATRPYKIVFTSEEFPQAVEILTQNSKNM